MIHGIINIYKEKGYTSHDVVAKMRGILKQKKIGHTGTLDPDAEGVLPVCLGAGTKLCDMLTERDKEYRAVLLLGTVTDTQDISGQVLASSQEIPAAEAILAATQQFVGEYDQIPPMYSALKVNGKKLYELAREGKTVERKARRVQIHEIVVEKIEPPRVTMTVQCSKGTYIRTLCHDIGETLGCGGCMESLLRTKVGRFTLENSITLAQLAELAANGRLEETVIPVDEMFAHLPACETLAQTDRLLYNGNALQDRQIRLRAAQTSASPERALDSGNAQGNKSVPGSGNAPDDKSAPGREHMPDDNGMQARMYDSAGKFCGVYKYAAAKRLWQPVKMFFVS